MRGRVERQSRPIALPILGDSGGVHARSREHWQPLQRNGADLRPANNDRLAERALVVHRCEWLALVVAGRAHVKQPALVVAERVDAEQPGPVERVGPAGDGLGSRLRRTV